MYKYDMRTWTFGYTARYYLTHPWKWFHEAYWNIRNFFHRAKYGFSYVDVWNMSDWFLKVIPDMLIYLKEHGVGYPGVEPHETPEKWNDCLADIAARLCDCADVEFDDKNEFAKAFHEMKIHETRKERTEEEQTLIDNYFETQRRLNEEREEKLKKTMADFAEILPSLWD